MDHTKVCKELLTRLGNGCSFPPDIFRFELITSEATRPTEPVDPKVKFFLDVDGHISTSGTQYTRLAYLNTVVTRAALHLLSLSTGVSVVDLQDPIELANSFFVYTAHGLVDSKVKLSWRFVAVGVTVDNHREFGLKYLLPTCSALGGIKKVADLEDVVDLEIQVNLFVCRFSFACLL